MYKWLICSRAVDALVRLALAVRSEQARLLNLFGDAGAKSIRD